MTGLAGRLAELSEACWRRGRELPRLAMKKLFEKDGEAYAQWNHSLPGYEPPHPLIAQPFASTDDLRRLEAAAERKREALRTEMVALQEEMDWLVYIAYGLAGEEAGVVETLEPGAPLPAPLEKDQRPYVLWKAAESDFDRALALIPAHWTAQRKALWRKRLEAIRDNEHIRRIEQPVYKRRWDEQWKVGGRWECGRVAYDHEFVEAFEWWLREKAEWWLEHEASGGPVELDAWTAALWEDPRVQAAWPVATETYARIALAKRLRKEAGREVTNADIEAAWEQHPPVEPTWRDFARRFKQIVEAATVPAGWPAAVPYDELARMKKTKVPTVLRRIRGKLNVPRERFRKLGSRGPYEWAGKDLFEDRPRL